MIFELLNFGIIKSQKRYWFILLKINNFELIGIYIGASKFDGGCKHYPTNFVTFCGFTYEWNDHD